MAIEGRTDRVVRVPAILRRHPALLVEWLRLVNSLSRWGWQGPRAIFVVLSAVAVFIALLFAWGRHLAGAIQTLAEYWVLLAVVAAIYSASSVSARRRQLEESKSQSWLIATPIPARSLLITQAIRVLLPLCVLVMTGVLVPALVALTTEGITAAAERVAAAAAGGLLIGAVVGWWTGRRAESSGVVPSRYVPQPRVRRAAATQYSAKPEPISDDTAEISRPSGEQSANSEQRSNHLAQDSAGPEQKSNYLAQESGGTEQTSRGTSLPSDPNVLGTVEVGDLGMRPDSAGLARWPIAQVLSWSRPENSRYVLIAALLAVQGGSSAVAGLSVVAMYFVTSYLAALVSAVTTVARSAAAWLRATPMTLMGFVWSISRRALAHQCVGVSLAVVCMLLLGAPIEMALQVAALWLGLFISISGFALVENYRGRSPIMKIALSVAAFAALATVLQLRAGTKT